MSVAVAHDLTAGISLSREVVLSIRARNADTHSEITLKPGSILSACRIRKHTASAIAGGAEPYVMEFESAGARYECALVLFQPRTRSCEVPADTLPSD